MLSRVFMVEFVTAKLLQLEFNPQGKTRHRQSGGKKAEFHIYLFINGGRPNRKLCSCLNGIKLPLEKHTRTFFYIFLPLWGKYLSKLFHLALGQKLVNIYSTAPERSIDRNWILILAFSLFVFYQSSLYAHPTIKAWKHPLMAEFAFSWLS